MQEKKFYDVKNVETGEEHSNVTAAEIRNDIIGKGINVSAYERTGKKYKDWLITEHVEKAEKKNVNGIYPFTEAMITEWREIHEKFQNVEWVKSCGKKLIVRCK